MPAMAKKGERPCGRAGRRRAPTPMKPLEDAHEECVNEEMPAARVSVPIGDDDIEVAEVLVIATGDDRHCCSTGVQYRRGA
eukprot:11115439-Alexandrium_andersonii.AAC.1